jgi:hypothetical protein
MQPQSEKEIRGSNAEKVRVLPLMGIALAVVAAGVLLDLVFELSKPSFISKLGAGETAIATLNSLAIVLLPVAAASAAAALLLWALKSLPAACHVVKQVCLFMLSASFITVLFVHLDMWAYSTFEVNVGNLPQVLNWLLLVALAFLSIYLADRKGNDIYLKFAGVTRYTTLAYIVLFALLAVVALNRIATKFPHIKERTAGGLTEKGLPNIILFSPDGLNASHMSLYGYERETTPNLDRLAESSLVFTRAYTNSGDTTGSVTSIFTGKSPLTTKVVFAPDILSGNDAYEHLPGILADLGYYCLDVGDVVYGIPSKLNMQLAFHSENGEETGSMTRNVRLLMFKRLFNLEVYFISEVFEKVSQRLAYMAGISDGLLDFRESMHSFMFSKFQRNPEHYSKENTRFLGAIEKIRELDRPVFAHIHLMRTHGPKFTGINRRFSAGKKQQEEFDPDFLDDAIYTSDYLFGKLLNVLRESGKFENTLIIFHTDHAQGEYRTVYPLPFVVHLPGQKERRTIEAPVQYLDIAPSVLKYLGAEIPKWMEGEPLFNDIDPGTLMKRPIFSIKAEVGFDSRRKALLRGPMGPPLYGIGYVSVLIGDLSYAIYKNTGKEEFVDFSEDVFEFKELDDMEKMKLYRRTLLSHLYEKGIEMPALK